MFKPNPSPKIYFALGLLVGLAIFSLVGFVLSVSILYKGVEVQEKVSQGSEAKKFNECLDSGKFKSEVEADLKEGRAAGVQGTPATFIGDELVVGALPFLEMKNKIEAKLKGESITQEGEPKGDASKISKIGEDEPIRGSKNASLEMIVFSDFECPFCAQFASSLEELLKEYSDQLKVAYRYFPLNSIHPMAQKAAEAAECAKEQGKFWEMHDKLFELSSQRDLTLESIKRVAGEIGLR